MSYEIAKRNDEVVAKSKYSKIDQADYQLYCEQTLVARDKDPLLEPEKQDHADDKKNKSPKHADRLEEKCQIEVPKETDSNQTDSTTGDQLPAKSSPALQKNENSEIKRINPKRASTRSTRSFDLSFTTFIRFLNLRKSTRKKSQPKLVEETNSVSATQVFNSKKQTNPLQSNSPLRASKYNTLSNSKHSKITKCEADTINKIRKEDSTIPDRDSKSNDNKKENNERSNIFYRFVRSFSFLYKRNSKQSNPNTNFKRSQSVQNYRSTRSAFKVKVSNNQSRSASTSTLNSPIGPIVRSNNPKQYSSILEPNNFKRGRTKSDIPQTCRPAQTSSIILESKIVSDTARSKTVLTDTIDASTNVVTTKSEGTISKTAQKNCVIASESGKFANGEKCEPHDVGQHRHFVTSGHETPAVCGIQNHGNTCFINSVIQCLSNTELLAEYFVFNHYRDDLLQQKFRPKKSGTGGELTEQLAVLFKSLWSVMYSSDISMKFKKIVSKWGEQYNGYEQHDAQEFLLWLLDKCNEDLTVQSKSTTKNLFMKFKKNANNKKDFPIVTDEAAAIESLAKYQTANSDSFIFHLFQGQLQSMVVCRNCHHNSKTYDPYMCISLPVPIRLTITIFIHAQFLDQDRSPPGMFGISIEAAATLRDLRDKTSRMIKVPEKRLILLQIDKRHGMIEFSNDTSMIQEVLEDFETIFALETPVIPDPERENQLIDIYEPKEHSNTMYQQMLTIVWINRLGSGKEAPIFGPLFTIVVSRECTFRKLQSLLLSAMSNYLIAQEGIDCDELSRNINLRLRISSGDTLLDSQPEYLSPEVDHPLFMPIVESILSKTEDRRTYRGPYHLKITIEWDLDIRRSILVSDAVFDCIYDRNTMFIDKSVEIAKERSNLHNRTTLQDCLDIYFREESLTGDNAWNCPQCNSRQQCVKQLSVWSLPHIFIIHLKRFRYMSNVRRIKINTMVEYPQNGLDMLKYVAHRKFNSNDESASNLQSSQSIVIDNGSKFCNRRNLQNSIEETTYNLYGVCCHHGTMQGGHYTAYCKNPVDNCWYLFDDTKVLPVHEEAVITADAYLLFYKKSSPGFATRELKTNYSTSTISSGYLSAETIPHMNHWAYHMPPFTYYNGSVVCYDKTNSTLPNRKNFSTNKMRVNADQHGNKISRPFNFNNFNATKHSNVTSDSYILQNGKKSAIFNKGQDSAASASGNYNNTFPRIKSRQASH